VPELRAEPGRLLPLIIESPAERPDRKGLNMRPTLYTVDHPGGGRLSTMAKPRGGDWLEDEMAALKAYGVDVLVCALTSPELGECDLDAEARTARDAGLQFVPIPISDRNVPDLATVLPTLQNLAKELSDGAHVVTHCRFGIGRASLLAAALLILNGTDPDTAWSRLERARGLAVPDTPEQREWTSKLPEDHPHDRTGSDST
jgi:protein-tyrosine phosphatase